MAAFLAGDEVVDITIDKRATVTDAALGLVTVRWKDGSEGVWPASDFQLATYRFRENDIVRLNESWGGYAALGATARVTGTTGALIHVEWIRNGLDNGQDDSAYLADLFVLHERAPVPSGHFMLYDEMYVRVLHSIDDKSWVSNGEEHFIVATAELQPVD